MPGAGTAGAGGGDACAPGAASSPAAAAAAPQRLFRVSSAGMVRKEYTGDGAGSAIEDPERGEEAEAVPEVVEVLLVGDADGVVRAGSVEEGTGAVLPGLDDAALALDT
eukprot:scaffold5892_cov112-Isochrysis_galbana.AAC.7